MDLFASKWNAQLPIFVSWRPQPNSWRVNAFNLSWSSLMGYAFPTFSLILRCLTEIHRERVQMVFDNPGVAESTVVTNNPGTCERGSSDHPPNPTTLLSSQGQTHPLIRTESLSLAAWMLSGHDTVNKEFRKKWSTFCWKQIVRPRELLRSPPGTIGLIGVLNTTKIPYQLI